MTLHPKLNLPRLRELGWSLWDPIGLKSIYGDWKGRPFEDEYDRYLIKAAGMIRNGEPYPSVVAYLERVESDHMGFGSRKNGLEKLQGLVQSIADDHSVWSDGDS